MRPIQRALQERLLNAVALHQGGRLDEARMAYEALLKKNPQDSDALHYLGLIASQKKDYAAAIELIGGAIKITPRNPAFHCNLGSAYRGNKQFAAGGGAAFAVLSDGTVKAWGRNHHGLLGAEEIRRSAVPIVVPGLDDVVSVAASVGYALALRRDRPVLVWGDGTVDASNFAGATGPSIHTEDAHPWTAKPLAIPNLRNVVAISAGSNAMALLGDGTVRTWGYNGHYSMGLGHNREYPKGLQTPKLQDVASIASGWNNAYFVLRNGTVLQAGGRREGYFKDPPVIWPK